MSVKTITAARLDELSKSGSVLLIDVRTPAEFEAVHVTFARNVPLDQLDPKTLGIDPTQPVYVVCQKGGRGQKACERLASAGFTSATNVEGGTLACVEAGLPVTRGKSALSIERQVRIAAGGLILVGVGLGFVHPGFAAIPAAVGLGLMYSGLTDSCFMGTILARMPWNRRTSAPSN